MTIVNLFSKRQKALRKEVPDVYQYDQIPRQLRVQIVHVLRDLFGVPGQYDHQGCLEAFQTISDALCREYGVFGLSQNILQTVDRQVVDFVLSEPDPEKVLDVIELSFLFLARARMSVSSWSPHRHALGQASTTVLIVAAIPAKERTAGTSRRASGSASSRFIKRISTRSDRSSCCRSLALSLSLVMVPSIRA
jgi:AbiJ-like protein